LSSYFEFTIIMFIMKLQKPLVRHIQSLYSKVQQRSHIFYLQKLSY